MSVNAVHSDEKINAVKASLLADVEAIDGDPTNEINALRKAKLVVKGGTLYKRSRSVSSVAYSTYEKSEVSRSDVDPGECRSTKERIEIIGLNERIRAISRKDQRVCGDLFSIAFLFTRVSWYHSDFIYDFCVSSLPDEIAEGRVRAWRISRATACTSPTTRT